MKHLFTVMSILLLAGCSSVTTSFDYDKSADFTKYKTYAFTEHATKMPGIQELDRDRILAAIDTEMAKRGFTKSDEPDALVDAFVKTEEELSATATTPGSYGRWGYGYGWGSNTTHIDYNKYIKGTLFVGVIDKGTDKIVWQGRGSKTLNEKVSPARKEANINSAVAAIFLKYPKSAGK